MDTSQHIVTEENAAKFADWLKNRGGIFVWESVNLANPGASWSTPAITDGKPTGKPTWQAGNTPVRHITDPSEVLVSRDREIKRFRFGVRMGGNGLSLKVTDGGSRKIRSEVAKAGNGAYHVFDYFSQQAVVMAPEKQIPLPEWLESVQSIAWG